MRTVYQKAAQRQRIIKEARKSGNISATARKHGIRRETVHRWIRQYTGDIESLKDKSRKPKHHPNEHTPQETEKIKRVYGHHREWGMVFLWVILTKEHGYTRSMSGLYKVLKREGLIRKKQRPKRYKPKIYEPILHPGERMQIDVKYVPKECVKAVGKKLYQYTAIDECTRWSYRWITEEHSTYSSKMFVEKLQKLFPYEIQCIQTDNGTEFTNWYIKKNDRLSKFENYLKSQGIRHKLIRPAMPRHNGKVERQHRTDGERFYRNRTFYSVKDANDQLKHYQRFANMAPRQVFNWKSANDRLLDFLLVV